MSNVPDRSSDPSRVATPRTLLSPSEVAQHFGVDVKTIANWHKTGKIQSQKTLGGHRRYHIDEVNRSKKIIEGNNG